MGIAALIGAIVVLRLARHDGERVDVQANALLAGYVAAFVGGHAFPSILALPSAIAAHDVMRLSAGRASYGALLGGAAATVLVLRLHRASSLAVLDRAAACAGFVFALLRVGCFLDGCDYGHVTGSVVGISFPVDSRAALQHADLGFVPLGSASLPVYPTQLFEAVLAIAASASVLPRVLRGDRSGEAALRCTLAYAGGRFFLEFLKEQTGGAVLGLSAGQWVSMALVVGCVLIHRLRDASRWPLPAAGAAPGERADARTAPGRCPPNGDVTWSNAGFISNATAAPECTTVDHGIAGKVRVLR